MVSGSFPITNRLARCSDHVYTLTHKTTFFRTVEIVPGRNGRGSQETFIGGWLTVQITQEVFPCNGRILHL